MKKSFIIMKNDRQFYVEENQNEFEHSFHVCNSISL